jgi:hypothetical protein
MSLLQPCFTSASGGRRRRRPAPLHPFFLDHIPFLVFQRVNDKIHLAAAQG